MKGAVIVLVSLCLLKGGYALPRGVAPENAESYSGSEFVCDHGSARIPMDRVNDEFCDCADGTDEPGTPACHNGLFYCPQLGYVGEHIFSSRVNDGICDCCDGADEWDGQEACDNECEEKGEELRLERQQVLSAYEEGVATRSELIGLALATQDVKRSRKEEVTHKLEAAKAELEEIGVLKKAAEEMESAERARVEAEREKEREAQREAEEAEALRRAMEGDDAVDGGDSDVIPDDVDGDVDGEEETVDEEPEEQIEAEYIDPAAEELRSQYGDQEKVVSDHEKELNEIEAFLSEDFGPDQAFHGVYKHCYDLNTREYTYSICPYDKAKQTPINGGSATTLGRWKGFSEGHTVMRFEDGDKCWGGPNRSMTVTLSCGPQNEVSHVDEPNRCEYTADLATPAACSEERLAELRREFAM